ncbi:MAG: hypothetical protein ABL933_04095 [Methyloglobulus sp.]
MKLSLIMLLLCWSFSCCAQQEKPLPKTGSCPAGYSTSGGYCKPTQRARFAVEKHGGCPAGYSPSGGFCLAGRSARIAVVKSGVCPAGWQTSGNYCLGD